MNIAFYPFWGAKTLHSLVQVISVTTMTCLAYKQTEMIRYTLLFLCVYVMAYLAASVMFQPLIKRCALSRLHPASPGITDYTSVHNWSDPLCHDSLGITITGGHPALSVGRGGPIQSQQAALFFNVHHNRCRTGYGSNHTCISGHHTSTLGCLVSVFRCTGPDYERESPDKQLPEPFE